MAETLNLLSDALMAHVMLLVGAGHFTPAVTCLRATNRRLQRLAQDCVLFPRFRFGQCTTEVERASLMCRFSRSRWLTFDSRGKVGLNAAWAIAQLLEAFAARDVRVIEVHDVQDGTPDAEEDWNGPACDGSASRRTPEPENTVLEAFPWHSVLGSTALSHRMFANLSVLILNNMPAHLADDLVCMVAVAVPTLRILSSDLDRPTPMTRVPPPPDLHTPAPPWNLCGHQ